MTAKSVRIVCPKCSAELFVNEQVLGRKMRCPKCDQTIRAVAPSAEPPVEADRSAPSPPKPPISPPRWTGYSEPTPPPVTPPPQPAAVLDEATPGVKKKAVRGFTEAEMDMTPMVDVTFQLLIFFMLTAAFTLTQAQQFPKPESTEPATRPLDPEQDPDFIIIRIDANNTFHVSGGDMADEVEAPSPQELMSNLIGLRSGAGGKVPTKLLVKAHGDCTHDRVVAAIDAGNDVGIEEVKVQTVEDEE